MRSLRLPLVIGNEPSDLIRRCGSDDRCDEASAYAFGSAFAAVFITLWFALFEPTSLFAQKPGGVHPSGFRIDTDVMRVDEAEPIIQSVTIFHDGVWYDYSRKEPQRITIVHPAENRIIFLDQDRQSQTTTSIQDLQAFLERARVELANSSLKEFLKDSEVVQIDEKSSTAVVGQHAIRYEAKFQAIQSLEIAKQYAFFANASAYINSWQSPDRSPPSFARVRLNQVLEQRQAIPTEITRTIFANDGQEHKLKSRLHVSWELSQEDRKSAQKYQEMLAVFHDEGIGNLMNPTRIGTGNSISSRKAIRK